jgi:primary-amine oxidase
MDCCLVIDRPEDSTRRLPCAQGFTYLQSSPNDNQYAHPLDLVPIVDLNERRVIRVDCFPEAPKKLTQDNNYHREFQQEFRTDIKPLNIVQPKVSGACRTASQTAGNARKLDV